MTAPSTEAELDELLSRPTDGVVSALKRCPGDILILGAGGKMGPSLASMARRALDVIGGKSRVIAVSRFGSGDARAALEHRGIETRTCNLLDRRDVAALPDAPNIVFMAGQKFGTEAQPSFTWALNAIVPAIVAERYAGCGTVVFSTGNVYPLTSIASGGPTERTPPQPVGEYAQSCLARERIFEDAALRRNTPVAILRLNYANDLRYGVLVDIGRRVRDREPVDLRMGYVNLLWQGDADARALQCLPLAASPALVLNLAGLEILSVRDLAERFGRLMGRSPIFAGTESPDALLNNATQSAQLFGPVSVPWELLLEWTADWLLHGGRLLNKPTHFEARDGRF